MKTSALATLLATLAVALGVQRTAAQGTAFTYQGRLSEGGEPANGSYDLLFILNTAAIGGSQIGPSLTNSATPVSGGAFVATLDFGAGAFPGPNRWLEIWVRTNVPGSVVTPTLQLSGAPGLDFGRSTRQLINLYNETDGTSYGLGVQNNRQYFRAAGTSGSGFAWLAGGSHVDAPDDAGPGGVQLMKLEYGPLDGCAGGGDSKFCGPGALMYVWGSIWSRDPSYAYSFESLSDRAQKTGFAPLDAQEILGRVAALPVTSWAFTNRTHIRHIGPMAQDFHSAFEVGMDDKHISITDEAGVALAAIQGLNQKLEGELKIKETESAG